MYAIIEVARKDRCIWEDLAQHNGFVIKHNTEIISVPNFDYYIILSEDSYLDIPKLTYLLSQYDPTEPIIIHGSCPNSHSLIMTKAARKSQITSTFNSQVIETDQIHGCNYLGIYRDNSCCDPKNILICEHMSDQAMKTYHSYLNQHPIFPKIPANNNLWTLITSYINPNDHQPYNSRWSRMTLSLNHNLVIFCEQSQYPFLYKKRKQYGLLDKTRIYPIDSDSLPVSSYQSKVDQLKFDPESNSSLYIHQMAIFYLIEDVIKNNPFNSSYFAWIDSIFSKSGLRNFELLDSALLEHRNEISLLTTDSIAKFNPNEPTKYFESPSTSLVIDFITGNKDYFSKFCQSMQHKFLQLLKNGLGSSVAHLISLVYSEQPEWFHLYGGKHQQIITNYTKILEEFDWVINQLIPRLRDSNQNKLGYDICQQIIQSYQDQSISINEISLYKLLNDYFIMAWWLDHKNICREITLMIMKYCENNSDFLRIVQGNPGQILKTTDYLDSLPGYLEKVELSEGELNGLDLNKKQVFIYGNYPVTSKSFILSNPVFRPSNLRVWKF